MAHVFISYVRDDQKRVDALVAALRAVGIEVWIDKSSIKPGERWQKAIRDAITSGTHTPLAPGSTVPPSAVGTTIRRHDDTTPVGLRPTNTKATKTHEEALREPADIGTRRLAHRASRGGDGGSGPGSQARKHDRLACDPGSLPPSYCRPEAGSAPIRDLELGPPSLCSWCSWCASCRRPVVFCGRRPP